MAMRGRFRLFALLVLLWGIYAPARSLEHLEAIVSRYSSLTEFLADAKGLNEYKEAYRNFLGESLDSSEDGFDSIWKKFLGQLRAVNKKIPKFGKQIWRLNPDWRDTEFGLQGDAKGSGLEGKRDALLELVEKVYHATRKDAAAINKLVPAQKHTEVERLVKALKTKYGILSKAEVEKLSRAETKAYTIRIGGDRKNNRPGLAADPMAKSLAAFLTRILISFDETLRDYLYSGDADMTYQGMRRLERLDSFGGFFEAQNHFAVKEILPYLRFSSKHFEKLAADYQRGRESMQAFRQIKDARPSPKLLVRLLELRAEGIEEAEIRDKLSAALKKDYDAWEQAANEVREKKETLASSYRSPYFKYRAVEDPKRKTLRLKSDAPLALTYVASPRPLHLLLAGRKNNECVGGGVCDDLVVKRWARAGLAGDRSLFSLNPDRTMEGFIGLTEVVSAKDPKPSWIVDLGSRATKGEVILHNEAGKPIKYTLFDALIDHLSESSSFPKGRFLISDGDTISANVAGSELRDRSQAYNENREVGVPGEFVPADPLAAKIAKAFPATLHDYGGGGLIFDGMINDGDVVYHLLPRKERRRWTKTELEIELFERGVIDKPMEEWIWTKAFESGVRLEPAQHYRNFTSLRKFFDEYVADFKTRFPDGAPPDELAAELDNFSRVLQFYKARDKHPVADMTLSENLAKNAIRYAGSSVAGKILGLDYLDVSKYGELQLEALTKNLNPNFPDAVSEQTARKLLTLAEYAPSSPRLLEADILGAILQILNSPLAAEPKTAFPAASAAKFLQIAVQNQANSEKLISKPVLSAVARALTIVASARKYSPYEKGMAIGPLLQFLVTAMGRHPQLESLVSNEIISSVEKALNLEDYYQPLLYKYAEEALKLHPKNERLLTSPLLALVPEYRLIAALLANPKEPRFDHPAVWNRMRQYFSTDPRNVTEVLLLQLKKNPKSGVFKYPGFLSLLRGLRDPAVGRLVAHFEKMNPMKKSPAKKCDIRRLRKR